MPFPSRKKSTPIALCPYCGSTDVETNPGRGDDNLSAEEKSQLDKYSCRDCPATFQTYIER
jgi:transposase-like protein